jgi:5-methylcytosine-specific restriction endonuclease McrA
MNAYLLTHLSDAALLRELASLVTRDRSMTALLLAHIAEVDARRLFVPAGYASMFAYCVGELRLSEDAAYKRIQAARAARRFPALFAALAEGRLHLTAISLLAPHLKSENAAELMASATHQGNAEIREFLARRFPEAGSPAAVAVVRPMAARPSPPHAAPALEFNLLQLAPEQVGAASSQLAREQAGASATPLAPTADAAPATLQAPEAQAVELFRLHVTIGKGTHAKLRYAQALLGHAVPSGDLEQVLDRALDALIEKCEKRKVGAPARPVTFATSRGKARALASDRPRSRHDRHDRHHRHGKRHVPAPVRRAVWERDQGRCTFVGTTGRRCGERKLLEFDHVDPVAHGGQATVERMRLRCRAHNQFEAERIFGKEFMKGKRGEARRASAEGQAPVAAERAQGEDSTTDGPQSP